MPTNILQYLKSKAKTFFADIVSSLTETNISKTENEVINNLGLVDVDDIKINIEFNDLEAISKTYEYKLLNLIKEQNLVEKSYSKNINNVYKYKKTRRLLNNVLISIVKALNGIKYENYDGVSSNDDNIFCKSIVYLDELVLGFSDYEYTLFSKLDKKVNVTALILSLIKSKSSFKDDLIKYISNLMNNIEYVDYVKNDMKSIDSARIKAIFNTYSSLEYNFKLRNSKNIAHFYKSIYDNKNNIEKSFYVVEGASISCSFCQTLSKLNVLNSKKMINKKNIAKINDTNIRPFEMCEASYEKICKPNLEKWQKKSDEKILDEYVLLSDSITFCKLGGIIKIVDPNQNKSSISNIDKIDNTKKYILNDYVAIESNTIEKILDMYFYNNSNIYNNIANIEIIENSVVNYLRELFRAKVDELKLENKNCIVAVNTYTKELVNIMPLSKCIKAYYLSKIDKNIISYDKYEKMSLDSKLKKIPLNFLLEMINSMPVVYSPYEIDTSKFEKKAYWMKKVFKEMKDNSEYSKLKKSVIKYHKLGANINADINTPWCSSFVNYIMNNGLKSSSSQIFYQKEGKKYYKKINDFRYGAIIVFKYSKEKGHVGFLVSKTKNGFYVIGGNQSGKIKKSFYKNDDKFYGIFWPK